MYFTTIFKNAILLIPKEQVPCTPPLPPQPLGLLLGHGPVQKAGGFAPHFRVYPAEFWEEANQPRLTGAWLQDSGFATGAFFHLPRPRAGTARLPGSLAFFFPQVIINLFTFGLNRA